MPTYTRLTGVRDLSRDNVTRSIEQNVIEFFKYAFVEAGGFTEVAVNAPGVADPYDQSALLPLTKQGVADGTIWQAQNTDWCYETGLESGRDPAPVTGVYVNGVMYPTVANFGGGLFGSTGFGGTPANPYGHHFDFAHGRVIFDSPVPTSYVVQAAYAYRWVSLYDSSVPWFKEVVLDAFYTQQRNEGQGGVLSVLNDYRVQTPLVVVEASCRQDLRPKQLGDSSHWVDQVVLFHVLTEDKALRDNLVNAITQQQNSTIYLFDCNARKAAADFPLDWRGSPIPGASSYPQAVAAYRWHSVYFERMQGQDVSPALPLYRGLVRGTLVTDFTSV